eukprot:TRINITY_DN23666_c0_g1_i1.p1 TRINITY_DN23666_c0_g1~~TRINITY_DN23666_c0_g1_i1.p1  ORF type:complete len:1100 (-),score=219.14 TRINITY_DN23666_c0_g1_i1:19-3318(-)
MATWMGRVTAGFAAVPAGGRAWRIGARIRPQEGTPRDRDGTMFVGEDVASSKSKQLSDFLHDALHVGPKGSSWVAQEQLKDLKHNCLWGDVALDLPLRTFLGRRTPTVLSCWQCHDGTCILCRDRSFRATSNTPDVLSRARTPAAMSTPRMSSRRSASRPASRQTPRPASRQTPRSLVSALLPALPQEQDVPPSGQPSPYWTGQGPSSWPKDHKHQSDIVQRRREKQMEDAWSGTNVAATRKSYKAHMPAWVVLRDETPAAMASASRVMEIEVAEKRREQIKSFQQRLQDRRKRHAEVYENKKHKEQNHDQERKQLVEIIVATDPIAEVENEMRRKMERKAARLERIRHLSRVGTKQLIKQTPKEEHGPVQVRDEEEDKRELDRQLLLDEGERLARAQHARDAASSHASFERYDEDGSGTLELVEIRAVLEDLGLLPQTAEEKSGVLQTLSNIGAGKEDGETDSNYSQASDEEDEKQGFHTRRSTFKRDTKTNKRSKEELARSIEVSKEDVSDLIERIRDRLKMIRRQVWSERFQYHDRHADGELGFPHVLRMLQELQLAPTDQPQIHEFAFWLLKTLRALPESAELRAADTKRRSMVPIAGLSLKPGGVSFGGVDHEGNSSSKRSSVAESKASQEPEVPKRISSPAIEEVESDDGVASPTDDDDDAADDADDDDRPSEKRNRASGSGNQLTLKDLRRSLGDRAFDKDEFEVITDFLTELRERQASEAQLQMAQDLGLKKVGLFMEFRHELKKHRDLFQSLDTRNTGFLNKEEVWLACTSLGMIPRTFREKAAVLESISKLCFKGTSARDREPYAGLILGLYSVEQQTRDDEPLPDPENITITGRMNLERFLEVLSKIRYWHINQLREDLRPLFDRLVRKSRGLRGEAVIHVAEISEALECLNLAPTKNVEQEQLQHFLNDVNEWGFNPLTLEFEGFVRFIRLVREWRNYSQSEEDCRFAEQQLGYAKRQAHVYQAIFEIVDKHGEGTLDMTGIRRAVKLLKRTHITSDELRELFARTDEDNNGSVSFNEFMQMVHEMEPPARETRATVFSRSSISQLKERDEEDKSESDKASEPLPWDVLSPGDDNVSAEPAAEEAEE